MPLGAVCIWSSTISRHSLGSPPAGTCLSNHKCLTIVRSHQAGYRLRGSRARLKAFLFARKSTCR